MVANEMTRSVQKKTAKCVFATATIAMMTVGTAQAAGAAVWNSATVPSDVSVFTNSSLGQRLSNYPSDYGHRTNIAYGVYIEKGSNASGTVTGDLTVKLESNQIETVAAIFSNKAYDESESYPSFASKNLSVSAISWTHNANVSALYVAEGGAICIDSSSSDETPTEVSLSATSRYGGFVVGILSHGERYYNKTTEDGGTIKIKTDSLTVNAKVESVEEITDGSGTRETPKTLSADYDGQVFGIHTSDKPGTGNIYLDAKTVNFNIENKAEFTTDGNGATYGIDITRGDIVSGLYEEGTDTTDTTFTITATAGYGSSDRFSMGGIQNKASTVNLGHETVTIKLNATKEGDAYTGTAATDAKGISVGNYCKYWDPVGEKWIDYFKTGSVALKGKLVEEIRSDTASATGIYVGGNDVTGTTSTAAISKVTVNSGADILAYTKSGSAYGLSLDGYEATYVEDSTTKKAYGSITIQDTVDIKAKAEGFDASTENPTVIGVTTEKGIITLGTANGAPKTVKITATGSSNKILDANTSKETGKYTTAIKSENSNIAIYGKTVEISSSGDGIVVSGKGVVESETDDDELLILAGSITSDDNTGTFSSELFAGSEIEITALDNALSVTGEANSSDDVGALLGAKTIKLEVTGDKAETDAVVFNNADLTVLGDTISIKSTGTGICASNNSEVRLGMNGFNDEDQEVTDRATSISIQSQGTALSADTKSNVNLIAQDITLGSSQDAASATEGENAVVKVANNLASKPTTGDDWQSSISLVSSGELSIQGNTSNTTAFEVGKGSELAISAGKILTNSNIKKAVIARADASVTLEVGEGTAFKGDLVFAKDYDYGSTTSQIDATGTVNFTLEGGTSKNAKWTGNSTIEHDSNTAFSAAVTNFAGKFIATLKNGASWITSAGENFFTKVTLENGSSVDASSATEFRMGGTTEADETKSIDVKGTGNNLKLGKDTETGTLTVRLLKSSEGTADVTPEFTVNAWATMKPTATAGDGTITAADKRLSFVSPTTDTNCAVGTLVVSDAFTIGMGAFNTVFTGEDGAIDTYQLRQGTLATASGVSGGAETANINNDVYLKAITGDGKVTVAEGKRLEVAPYTDATAGTPAEASTRVGTLTLGEGAKFYAKNNGSVQVTKKLDLGKSATVEITSSATDNTRTETVIGELTLADGATFKTKNNKSVSIASGATGTGSTVSLGDVTATSNRVDIGSFTVGASSNLNVEKSSVFDVATSLTLGKAGKLSSLNNAVTEIEEIFLADGEKDAVTASGTTVKHTRAEFTSSSTSPTGQTKISKVHLGDYATVSVTGNNSAQIGQIFAGSGIGRATGTGANAEITVTNNQSVTFNGSIVTGESAVITVKENSGTAFFMDSTLQAVPEISLGSKTKFIAEDAAVKATTLKLANGEGAGENQYTLFSITGVGSGENHYSAETISITDLYLGKYAQVDLEDNYSVKITNIYAGADSSSTTATDAGLDADVTISGSKTAEVTNLNLGKKGSFTAKTGIEKVKIDSITTADSDNEANRALVDIAGTSSDSTVGEVKLGAWSRLTASNVAVITTGSTTDAVEIGNHAQFDLDGGSRFSTIGSLKLGDAASFTVTNATLNVSEINSEATSSLGSITLGKDDKSATLNVTASTDVAKVNAITLNNASAFNAAGVAVDLGTVTLNDTSRATIGSSTASEIDALTVASGATFNVAQGTATVGSINATGTSPAGTLSVGTAADSATGTAEKSATLRVTDTSKVLQIGTLSVKGKSTFDATGVTSKISTIETALGAEGTGNHTVVKLGSASGSYSEIGNLNLGAYTEISLTRAKVNSSEVNTLNEGVNLTLTGDKTDDATVSFTRLNLAESSFFTVDKYKTVTSTDLWLGDDANFTSTDSAKLSIGTVHAGSGEVGSTGQNANAAITGAKELTVQTLNLGKSANFKAASEILTINKIEAAEGATLEVSSAENQASRLGAVTLGKRATLEAINVGLYSDAEGAVNVTLEESSQFNLDSNNRASKIGALDLGVSSQFTVKNATIEVDTLTGSGNLSVGSAVAGASGHSGATVYVKNLSMTGGSIYVDPVYGDTSVFAVESLGTGSTLNTNITAGPGALVTIGMGSATAALAAVQENLENKTTIKSSSSLIYVAKAMTLGATGSLTADPTATAAATGVDGTVNAKNGGVIVIDQEKVGVGTTVFSGANSIVVDDASDGTTSSTLAVINIVDGTTVIPLTDVNSPTVLGNNYTVLTDNPYVTATLDRAAGVIRLTEGATDNGMTVIASIGAQSMIRRIDTVLSKAVANRFTLPSDSTKGANLWADISGERYEQDHIGAGASFAADMGYGTFGAEVAPTAGTLLGAAFQYSHGTLKGDTYSVKNKIKAYSATAYGAVDLWDTGVKLTAEVAFTKDKNDVSTSYYSGLMQDFDTKMISGAFGVQKTFTLGGFDVTPSVGVRLSKIKTDAMKAGLIEVAKQSETLVQVPIAVRFNTKTLETQSGWAVTPKFKFAFTPTFGDKEIEAFGEKCTVIDVNPVEAAFGIGFTKGNFTTDIEANFGAGSRGTTSLGGKIGVNYRF